MDQVRYGLIGYGKIGSQHAGKILQGKVPSLKLCAVADTDPARLQAAREALGDSAAYFDSAEALMDSGLVDAVHICTPHYLHPSLAIYALEHGLHTLVEKPAGVYTAQVRRMNAVAQAHPELRFAMDFNQRTDPVYIKTRELVKSGAVGRIVHTHWLITNWYRSQSYYDQGGWRATWKGEGGGVLINQCPHQLDLVQWVVGEMPVSVNGFCKYGKWHDVEGEDEVTAYFEYASGASGVFITTTGEAPGTNRFEVSGTKGKLLCENKKLFYYKNAEDSQEFCKTSKESFAAPKCEVIEPETDGLNEQHVGILKNFSEAILGAAPLFVDGKEGFNGVELMNAIELSGWQGGVKVSLPIDGDAYYKELMKHVAVSRFKTGNDNAVEGTLNFGTGFVKVKSDK